MSVIIIIFVILTCPSVVFLLNFKTGYKSDINKEMGKSQNVSNFILKIIQSDEVLERQNISISAHIRKYYKDLEKHPMCIYGRKIVDVEPPDYNDCPKSGIVTVEQGGRLGNQIWEYISVWLVAKKTGLKPYVPKCIKQTISKLFDNNLDIPDYDDIRFCSVFKEEIEVTEGSPPWIYKRSIILPIYCREVEMLGDNINEIRKIFTIKKKLLDESKKILLSGLSFLNVAAGSIFIGVHVRRTDYISYIYNKHKLVPDVLKFIRGAMSYYEHKFHNSIFILVSDDPKWYSAHFHNKRNVYITGNHHKSYPELDIALMASCNHSIIDYGTFGEWGAILAGGETIFFSSQKPYYSSKLGTVIKSWHKLN